MIPVEEPLFGLSLLGYRSNMVTKHGSERKPAPYVDIYRYYIPFLPMLTHSTFKILKRLM